MNLPLAVGRLTQLRVARETAAAKRHDLLVAQHACCQCDAVMRDAPVWRVADARNARVARRGHHALDGHLGASQRPGFIGADDRR